MNLPSHPQLGTLVRHAARVGDVIELATALIPRRPLQRKLATALVNL